jgi:hypothetical protein
MNFVPYCLGMFWNIASDLTGNVIFRWPLLVLALSAVFAFFRRFRGAGGVRT